jgi:hypothetical protein
MTLLLAVAERESRTHLAVGMLCLGHWSGKSRLLRKGRAFRKWSAMAAGEDENPIDPLIRCFVDPLFHRSVDPLFRFTCNAPLR